MRVLTHITARAGSRGIPGKNLRRVGGVSLVGHAVRCAQAWLASTQRQGLVFVDTDGAELAAEGRRWGASVPFLRAEELAGDRVTSVDTVLGAVERLAAQGERFERLVLLQPTSPLRVPGDLEACWGAAAQSGTALTVTSLEHPLERALTMASDGSLAPVFGTDAVAAPRQAHAPRVAPNGAVYVIDLELLGRERSLLVAGRTRGVVMPAERSLDIDHEPDLLAAERWLEARWCQNRPRARLGLSEGVRLLRPDDLPTPLAPGVPVAIEARRDELERARRLAIGLGAELALAVDADDALLVGYAAARGVTAFLGDARLAPVVAAAAALTAGGG